MVKSIIKNFQIEYLQILDEDGKVDENLMPSLSNKEIKKLYPEYKIIGMTGGGNLDSNLVGNATTELFNVFLAKPFARADLLTAVESFIGKSVESGAI